MDFFYHDLIINKGFQIFFFHTEKKKRKKDGKERDVESDRLADRSVGRSDVHVGVLSAPASIVDAL